MTSKNEAQYILIAADSISALRKTDVFRVLQSVRTGNIDGVTRVDIATYIARQRPDLLEEVKEVMSEEFPGDGWKAEGETHCSSGVQQSTPRSAADSLTIAYIAIGAKEALQKAPCVDLGVFEGELSFIDAVVGHAKLVDCVSDVFDATGDHPGVFVYDVASPFGEATARAMLASGRGIQKPEAILIGIMIAAGYPEAKVEVAVRGALMTGSIKQ